MTPRLDKASKHLSDELIKLGFDPKELFGVSCEFDIYKFKEKTEYVPEIVYKYTIDGMEYSNNKISVTEKKFSSRYECQKFIGNFSSTGLEVCYDPNNKNDSYLIISTKDTYWFYGGGVIAIVIAIIMILNRNTLFAQAATAYDMVT